MRLIDVNEVFICGFLALIVISSLALCLHLLLRLFTLIPNNILLITLHFHRLGPSTMTTWTMHGLHRPIYIGTTCWLELHAWLPQTYPSIDIINCAHIASTRDYNIYNIAKGHEAHTCDKPWPNSLYICFLGSPTPYAISAFNLYSCFSHWTIFTIVICHLRSNLMYFIHPLDVIKSHYYRLFGCINERRDV